MVEFKKHVKKRRSVDVKDLPKLFESLDRKTSHTELRPAQTQALQDLKKSRSDRDLVLKISTGAGKTGVGLLWLLSHMEENEEPAVYLCPTVQLVHQALEEAERLGISATPYLAGERYPSPEATGGKSIIVCTYDKLFNAKTTFDRINLRPCAMVLDDAHAGLEEVRDAFTLSLTDPELQEKILDLVQPGCQKYNVGIWQDIVNGDPHASMEVPYWLWRPILNDVQSALSSYAAENTEDNEFVFVWPYLRDILPWCRCILGGNGIEIIPEVVPIAKSRAYDQAKHRLFMSATLADDSVLVRDLGCSVKAASHPLRPKADRGLGERMALAPSLIDPQLNRVWIMEQCARLAKKWRVVVLTSSERRARDWKPYGAYVCVGDGVADAIRKLKDQKANLKFVAFPQRYDGIDLPDDACRILVIDGMPYGEGVADRYESSLSAVPGGTRARLVYRLEQGMGRAVRSHVDYAVILLSGDDLAHFIARKDVLNRMNPDTRAQLELALDLAKLAQKDGQQDKGKVTIDMIDQCLGRDPDWKQYYEENVRKRTKNIKAVETSGSIELANAEHKAFELATSNRANDAVRSLRQALNTSELEGENKAWYLQEIAFYQNLSDPAEAIKTQAAAHDLNRALLCPPGVAPKSASTKKFRAQSVVLEWFRQFEHANGAIAAIQVLRAQLSYSASTETIEQAIMDLAPLLGAKGSRPEREFSEGPDDLWLWPERSLVIEAKTQNEDSLHKSDASQLLNSLQWFEKAYPTREKPVPVVVAKVDIADRKAGFPPNTRVLTQEKLIELLDQLEAFFRNLATTLSLLAQPHVIEEQQVERGLTADQFVTRFTLPLREAS